MSVKIKRSITEQRNQILEMYRKETNATLLDMKEVAAWALGKGLMEPSRRDAIKQCAHELARAAADAFYNDPQGRRVRKNHAARQIAEIDGKKVQYVLWADIENAPPNHMKMSLQQRRQYVVYDCKQLKTDLDSYNQNNKHGAQLELGFDFREDIEELNLPTVYQPE